MIEHTQGQWEVCKVDGGASDDEVVTTVNGVLVNICQVFGERGYTEMIPDDAGGSREGASYLVGIAEARENARRIVACVNSCAGISTAALEEAATSGQRVSEMLLQQRNEAMESSARLTLALEANADGQRECLDENRLLRQQRDELLAALTEYLAAADHAADASNDDDIEAMIRFALAEESARAAIAKVTQP